MKKVSPFQLGVKIFFSIVLTCVIGIMLNFTLIGAFEKTWSTILVQTIDFLLILALAYSTAWRDGYSEMNRVKIGFATYDPMKGLKAGCFAVIPGALITAALAVSHYLSWDWAWIYRIINMYELGYINAIMDPNVALREIPVGTILLTGVHWLVIPLLCWGAFILGYRRFSFMELFYFKKKKPEKNRKVSGKK